MKLCASATGNDLASTVDPRFGRCQYFLFVDSETMDFESVGNPAFTAGGGAGIQAAQLVVNRGAGVVLTGNVGPNAFQALQAAGIKIVTGISGTVKEAVEKFKKGEVQFTGAPTVGSHFGMGR
jgi:predicted Fe-Mo cluster-binding NifX family protein